MPRGPIGLCPVFFHLRLQTSTGSATSEREGLEALCFPGAAQRKLQRSRALHVLQMCATLRAIWAWKPISQLFFSFQNEFLGESGWVKIDRYGDRTDFQLEIRKLNEEHTLEGTWSGANGLLWSGRKTQVRHQNNFAAGRPLVISTVLVLLDLFFSLADIQDKHFFSRANLMLCWKRTLTNTKALSWT